MNICIHAANGVSIHQFCLTLIQRLQERKHHVFAIAKQDDFFSDLQSKHVLVYNSQISEKHIGVRALVRYIRRIRTILKDEKVNLIQLMSPKAIIFIPFFARLLKVKTVCVLTGLGYVYTLPRYHPLRIATSMLYRCTLIFAHVVVFLNSDDIHHFLRWRIVSQRKTVLIRSSGVDTTHYHRRETAYPQQITYLFVGRLMIQKGITYFLQAAWRLRQANRSVRFLVVGNSDYGSQAMVSAQQVERYRRALGESIQFCGLVKDVRPLLGQSSALVLPTYYREGVPQSILEAMSYGLPIIATDMPGCREAVANNQNGLLIPPRNLHALIAAMEYFIDNRQEVARMGRQSRLIVEREFSSHIVDKQTLAAYRKTGVAI